MQSGPRTRQLLRSFRRLEAPKLGAHHAVAAIIHADFRVHAVDCSGVINEDALIARAQPRVHASGRATVTILLAGRARLTCGERAIWMSPGEAVAMDDKSLLSMRQEGSPYRALSFEWDAAALGRRAEPFTVLSRELEPRALFDAIADPSRDGDEEAGALFALMSSLGIDLPIPEDRGDALEHRHAVQLTQALDALLSDLTSQPMASDLERKMG